MRIPHTLKIGGHTVKVVQTKMEDNPQSLMGKFDTTRNILTIDAELVQSQKEVTLFHEILHAINTEWDNQINGHALLESIAQQLYQVLSDNNMLK